MRLLRVQYAEDCGKLIRPDTAMPSSVADIFGQIGAGASGVVRWDIQVPMVSSGVYLVSLCEDVHSCMPHLADMPVDLAALERWLTVRPELRLDGLRPDAAALAERLSKFWLPDEVVLYIGLASSLGRRIGEYYKTPLGARKPHAGGYFLKTLSNLPDLFVHYFPTANFEADEQTMLGYFCQNVSVDTKNALPDPTRPFPFANLVFPPGRRKPHGISGAREPKRLE